MKPIHVVACVMLMVGAAGAEASQYQLDRSVVVSGGECFARSSRYLAGNSTGQVVIGIAAGTSHRATFGFWDGGSPPVRTMVPNATNDPQVVFQFALAPSAPNPFRSSTTIRYDITTRGSVSLIVFDVRGRVVRRLIDGELDPGRYLAAWDGRDATGRQEPPGIYFYRISTPGFTEVRKAVRLE